MKYLSILVILILIPPIFQSVSAQQTNDPRSAFLRSMVFPGWGHYYNDRDAWNRGKVHFATELGIIATYIGFQYRSSTLQSEYITLANLRSGVDIRDRNRNFQIALSDFPSLAAYNEFQLRTRNWNRLLDVNSQNNWQWQSERDRLQYGDLRSRRDRIKNQLPALLSLMVINRVISAVSAYNGASQPINRIGISLLPFAGMNGSNGALTKVSFRF